MMSAILAVIIFLLTLTLVIWQPKTLSIGWSACGGALIALLAGVVHLNDVRTVIGIIWNATLAFVAIIIISLILDRIGFFEWAAVHMARLADGHGIRMFIFISILGALISAFFTNDGGALILTPIVLAMVRTLKLDSRHVFPFVMASGFIADTTSLPLVVSNLVNIISADFFGVSFGQYALHMIIPTIFSLVSSIAVLYLYFRKDWPQKYQISELKKPSSVLKDTKMFHISWFVLIVLVIGYFVSSLVRIPVSFITLGVAFVFLFLGSRSKAIHTKAILKSAPWSIVFFSLGMYVVVYGLRNAGIIHFLSRIIEYGTRDGLLSGTMMTGFLSAVLSALMNNLPTVMITALSVDAASATGVMHQALVYAGVVGADLGPKMTPIGSLATLLWLHVLSKKGVKIRWGQYFKIGIVMTVPVLFATLAGVYLSVLIFG